MSHKNIVWRLALLGLLCQACTDGLVDVEVSNIPDKNALGQPAQQRLLLTAARWDGTHTKYQPRQISSSGSVEHLYLPYPLNASGPLQVEVSAQVDGCEVARGQSDQVPLSGEKLVNVRVPLMPVTPTCGPPPACDPMKQICPCDPMKQICPCDPMKQICPCDPTTGWCTDDAPADVGDTMLQSVALRGDEVWIAGFAKDGTMLSGRIWRRDTVTRKWAREDGGSSYPVYKIYVDPSGTVWTGNSNDIRRYTGQAGRWVSDHPFSYSYNSLWGTPDGRLWAATFQPGPLWVRSSDGKWQGIDLPTGLPADDEHLGHLWGTGSSLWAGKHCKSNGDPAIRRRESDTNWPFDNGTVTFGSTQWLPCIWGTGPNDVYAANGSDQIHHRGSGGWEASPLPGGGASAGFFDCGGSAKDGSVWFAGAESALVRCVNGMCVRISTGLTPSNLMGLAGNSSGDIWIVGDAGLVVHHKIAK